MLYLDKIPSDIQADFQNKTESVANNLGTTPDNLMAVMDIESGLNPHATNPYTQATGLIQFMPSTLAAMGYMRQELLAMNATDQLDLVNQYLQFYKSRNLKELHNLYLAIFYPAAIGKPDSFILGSERSNDWAQKIGSQNKIYDLNGDGYVSVGELKQYLANRFPNINNTSVSGRGVDQKKKLKIILFISGSAILIGTTFYLIMRASSK